MIFKNTIYNLSHFIFGFLIGLLIDIIATQFYKRFSFNKVYIIIGIFLQLFTVFYIIELLNFRTYTKFGILISQFVLFDYAIKCIYNPTIDLNCN